LRCQVLKVCIRLNFPSELESAKGQGRSPPCIASARDTYACACGTQFFHNLMGVPVLSNGLHCSMIRSRFFCTYILYKVHLHTPIAAEVYMSTSSTCIHLSLHPFSPLWQAAATTPALAAHLNARPRLRRLYSISMRRRAAAADVHPPRRSPDLDPWPCGAHANSIPFPSVRLRFH
jgi:hypothetical protein